MLNPLPVTGSEPKIQCGFKRFARTSEIPVSETKFPLDRPPGGIALGNLAGLFEKGKPRGWTVEMGLGDRAIEEVDG